MPEPSDDRRALPAGAFNFRVTLRKSGPRGAGGGAGDAGNGDGGGSGGPARGERLADGGFQECSGLEIEMDVQEHREGGRNDGVVQLVGRGTYRNVVLKRGMFFSEDEGVNRELWRWLQDILAGRSPVRRYDGIIELLNGEGEPDGEVLATWTFSRGLPVKVSGPTLNARTGEIAIEELHIAHEGLRLEEG